jgi:hypothetical protein
MFKRENVQILKYLNSDFKNIEIQKMFKLEKMFSSRKDLNFKKSKLESVQI